MKLDLFQPPPTNDPAEPEPEEPGTSAKMRREQNAFINKYGMRMEDAQSEQQPTYQGSWLRYVKDELIVDPTADSYYKWNGLVALAYVYNLFVSV